MKSLTISLGLLLLLTACESTVKANYNTIRAKKVIIVGDDEKEFLLTVKYDSLGTAVLGIEEYKD